VCDAGCAAQCLAYADRPHERNATLSRWGARHNVASKQPRARSVRTPTSAVQPSESPSQTQTMTERVQQVRFAPNLHRWPKPLFMLVWQGGRTLAASLAISFLSDTSLYGLGPPAARVDMLKSEPFIRLVPSASLSKRGFVQVPASYSRQEICPVRLPAMLSATGLNLSTSIISTAPTRLRPQ
jgi:hypothetical protein